MNQNINYKEIISIILDAANKVTNPYLSLKTTYEPKGIIRERVFCYELYHQIRMIVGENYPLKLNGEIDKRGHKDFVPEDRKNPDFVFHIPTTHENNTVVMEVKGNINKPKKILKDFETLHSFVSKYNYQAGIFLLYNHKIEDLINVIRDRIEKFIDEKVDEQIYIITLPGPHAVEEVNSLAQIRKKMKKLL